MLTVLCLICPRHFVDTSLQAAVRSGDKGDSIVDKIKFGILAIIDFIVSKIAALFDAVNIFKKTKVVVSKDPYTILRDKVVKRASEYPGMWPPVVVPPAAGTKRSIGDIPDHQLKGKR